MKPLDCQTARRRLQAFHDQELSAGEQIAMAGHLDRCDECRLSLADLRILRAALRTAQRGDARLSAEEAAAFTTTTVTRLKAEQDASFAGRMRLMFEDMHLVYVGLGATVAALACIVVVQTMVRLATGDRPDSLAAMVSFLATPGTSGNSIAIDHQMQTRWHARFRQANETAEQDAVFALSSVVTRGGRVTTLAHLRDSRRLDAAGRDDAKLIEALLDGLSRARFTNEMEGRASAASVVWLVTSTTVRATKSPGLDLPLPAGKRQVESPFGSPTRPVRV